MSLPELRCDRKCIQNDLDMCRNAGIEIHARCDAHPNQFICTSGHNTGIDAMLAQAYIVNRA